MIVGLQVACAVLSVLLIVAILAQRGSGSGLSELFGGGASDLQSSAAAPSNVARATVVLTVLWFGTVIAVGVVSSL